MSEFFRCTQINETQFPHIKKIIFQLLEFFEQQYLYKKAGNCDISLLEAARYRRRQHFRREHLQKLNRGQAIFWFLQIVK